MASDTLLDLHAKLSTVVRYYDRMLEERLSNTYAQHTIGQYNSFVPSQPAPNIYPSMPPNVTGGAESFYFSPGQPEMSNPPQNPPPTQQNLGLSGYDPIGTSTSVRGSYGAPNPAFGGPNIGAWNESASYDPHGSSHQRNPSVTRGDHHAMPPGHPPQQGHVDFYGSHGVTSPVAYNPMHGSDYRSPAPGASPISRRNSQYQNSQPVGSGLPIHQPASNAFEATRSPPLHAVPHQQPFLSDPTPAATYNESGEDSKTPTPTVGQRPFQPYMWQQQQAAPGSQPLYMSTPLTPAQPYPSAAHKPVEESLIEL